MKVVITGSLGNIGKPLASLLVERGHKVAVISSKPDRTKDIEAIGATASIGTIEDIPFLTAAFKGAEAVYLMIPPNFFQPNQLDYYVRIANKYADAVRHSGVKRIVNLSSYGADLTDGTGFIKGSNRCENIFDKLDDVAVTHVRPGYFYSNLYSQTEMIKHQGLMGSNYGGDDKLVMVAPADIAAAIVEELEIPATHRKITYVAGDDRSASEIAQVIGAAIGNPDLKWIQFSNEQLQSALENNGIPKDAAENLVELGAAIHSGVLRSHYDKQQPILKGVKLEEFAKEFAAGYLQKQ